MSLLPHTPAAWRGSPLARLTAALPDLVLGLGFLITWMAPYTFRQKALSYFLLVMLLEFLIVHSAGFMGSVAYTYWFERDWAVHAGVGFLDADVKTSVGGSRTVTESAAVVPI